MDNQEKLGLRVVALERNFEFLGKEIMKLHESDLELGKTLLGLGPNLVSAVEDLIKEVTKWRNDDVQRI